MSYKEKSWTEFADKVIDDTLADSKLNSKIKNQFDFKAYLKNPLSEIAKGERKALLGVSLLAVSISYLGIEPSQINAVGFSFNIDDFKNIYLILKLVIIYFLVAFSIHAYSDFLNWFLSAREATKEIQKKLVEKYSDKNSEEIESLDISPDLLVKSSKPVTYLRAFIEFGFPIVFAIIVFFFI